MIFIRVIENLDVYSKGFIEFLQFGVLQNHTILNSARCVDCIVKGITEDLLL